MENFTVCIGAVKIVKYMCTVEFTIKFGMNKNEIFYSLYSKNQNGRDALPKKFSLKKFSNIYIVFLVYSV